MTKSSSTPAVATLRKAILLLLVVACFLLAVIALLEQSSQIDILIILGSQWLFVAIFLQLVALFLFVLAWHVLLKGQTLVVFSESETSSHISVTLLGKYLPGKIWGLLGRGYLMTQRGLSKTSAAHFLIVDQFLTFYSGLAIGFLAILSVYFPYSAIITVVIITLATPVALAQYPKLLILIKQVGNRLSSKIRSLNLSIESPIARSTLTTVLGIYIFHWLITSIVLCILFEKQIQQDLLTNVLLFIAAIPLGMLSGFVALWAPGGIGVREGVIVAILSLNLDWEIATSVAIVYRLICIFNDLVMGVFALMYFSKHPQLITIPQKSPHSSS